MSNQFKATLPAYSVSEKLREDGEIVLLRGRRSADGIGILAALPASERVSSHALARFEKEYALRDQLELPWAAKPIEFLPPQAALILLDPGGVSLESLRVGDLALREKLRVAIAATSALAKCHAAGLIHKDVKPGNFLVNASSGSASLVGFGLASRLARERQAAEPPKLVMGTLAYMAPEQTGRMNRSIDLRSDLYSLGVVLYELFTGALPFTADNPLQLMHAHIARVPVAPAEKISVIPAQLSAIIVKLLAKTAEDRYQTAQGAIADLKRCLEQLEKTGRVERFPLALEDGSDRLLIPEKLYGRHAQVQNLLGAFERVLRSGQTEVILVSGYSGIGKSSLVAELDKRLLASRGLIATGKFELNKRSIPYATLARALQQLVQQVLVKPEQELTELQNALSKAIAPNERILVELVPQLEILVGPTRAVPNVSPRDARARFHAVLTAFLGVFATSDQPLVLFLDDLQWLDSATFELLEALLCYPAPPHILFIGAYRDNEVDASHPLTATLDLIRRSGTPVSNIVLAPLSLADVKALLSDMLHTSHERIEPLARLVHDKTLGNPFFVLHFVMSLHDQHLLEYALSDRRWVWDLQRIREQGYTDNVADLMTGKLSRLPPETQRALQILACLGMRAEVELLSRVLECENGQVCDALWEAERRGLVLRSELSYVFSHDRIQEAAYALIPEHSRPAQHLYIARLLLGSRSVSELDGELFEITDQFNRGLSLIGERREQELVFQLNVRAGKKAKSATAFAAARDYLSRAASLLAVDSWSSRYEVILDVLLELSECEYVVGEFERADELFADILAHAQRPLDSSKVYNLRMRLYQVSGRYQEAFACGLQGLRLFGIECPKPDETDINNTIAAERAQAARLLAGRKIRDLLNAPDVDEPEALAVIDLYNEILPCAYGAEPLLFAPLVLKALNFSLRSGNAPGSCFAYSCYAMVLTSLFDDLQGALEFSEMSLCLNEKYNDAKLRGTLLNVHGGCVLFWKRPFASCRPFLEQAFIQSINVGDLVYAGYNVTLSIWNSIEMGEPLPVLRDLVARYREFAVERRQETSYYMVRQFEQFIECLLGATRSTASLEDDAFDETRALEYFTRAKYIPGLVFHHVLKEMAAYHMGRYEEALEQAEKADALQGSMSLAVNATQRIYHALSLLALFPNASPELRHNYGQRVERITTKLAHWAESCPENFQGAFELVCAEKARVEGRELDAIYAYERAIRAMRASGAGHKEALASELAGRFYWERGFEKNAEVHFRHAREAYLRVGGLAKVEQLDQLYPELPKGPPVGPATVDAPVGKMDLSGVIKAAQTVSGEIELGSLIEKLVGLVVDYAGAERGLLMLPRDEDFVIEAEATMGREGLAIRLESQRITSGQFSASIFRYVQRTRQIVILDDASSSALFSDDPYILAKRARSVLCIPLLKQAQLVGVLYLENRLAPGAFTQSRVAMLNILAAQAAISLQNARLYADLATERSRLQAVIRQVPVGLIVAEAPSGKVVHTNPQVDVIMREPFWAAESIKHYDTSVGYHPDGSRYTTEEWPLTRSLTNGEVVNDEEVQIQRPDGSRAWVGISSSPVRDGAGRITAGVVVVQDIDERKKREEIVRSSEERFAKAFHNNPTPMAVIRMKDWYFVDANESFLTVLGYQRAEVARHSALEIGNWLVALLERAAARVSAGKPFRDQEFAAASKSGEARVLLTSVDTIELRRENCFLATFIDLTERKRVEDQLRHSQRMEAMGRIAGGIAHDFNNLLTVINGYSAWALRAMDSSNPLYHALREISNAGQRGAQLSSQLLAYSRKQVLEPKVWDLNAIVSGMERMLTLLVGDEITIETVLSPDIPRVKVDRGQVEQIIMNLAVNARDAMPQGGRLVLETSNTVREQNGADAESEGGPRPHVRLAVSDSGVGMTEDVMAHIFEPFFTTKEPGKGTGLGLAVAYGIVQQSGGTISVSSKPGQGTTFQIYIPGLVEDEASVTLAEPDDSPLIARGSETILLVEDEEPVRTFAAKVLEAQGYRVHQAASGSEALAILDGSRKVDLVLTDLAMPDMGGTVLARNLREHAPGLPVLFMSGYPRRADAPGSKEDSFLAKPFGPSELLSKVHSALHSDRALRGARAPDFSPGRGPDPHGTHRR